VLWLWFFLWRRERLAIFFGFNVDWFRFHDWLVTVDKPR
jgi:hypothetical protein